MRRTPANSSPPFPLIPPHKSLHPLQGLRRRPFPPDRLTPLDNCYALRSRADHPTASCTPESVSYRLTQLQAVMYIRTLVVQDIGLVSHRVMRQYSA